MAIISLITAFIICFANVALSLPLSSPSSDCGVEYYNHNYGKDYSDNRKLIVKIGQCQVKATTNATEELNAQNEDELVLNGSQCEPRCLTSHWNNKELRLLLSTEIVQSAEQCRVSVDHCEECQLKSSYHTYHSNQPSFATTVDLGLCQGKCNNSDSCVPIQTTDIAIKGPNGYKTVSKTTKCGCAFSKCYRQGHFQEVFSPETKTSKVVDVGRCVGKCIGESITICFPEDSCIISFQRASNICLPTSTAKYMGVDVIQSCGCGIRY